MKAEGKPGVRSVRPGCCRSLEKSGHQALQGQRRHAAREKRGQPQDGKLLFAVHSKGISRRHTSPQLVRVTAQAQLWP